MSTRVFPGAPLAPDASKPGPTDSQEPPVAADGTGGGVPSVAALPSDTTLMPVPGPEAKTGALPGLPDASTPTAPTTASAPVDRMFVVLVHYVRPLPEVDQHTPAHRAFLETLYASGRLLGSGRRVPPVGGVILARGGDQAELEAVFADDPFVKTGVARYEYIAFEPNPQPRRSSELDAFLRR